MICRGSKKFVSAKYFDSTDTLIAKIICFICVEDIQDPRNALSTSSLYFVGGPGSGVYRQGRVLGELVIRGNDRFISFGRIHKLMSGYKDESGFPKIGE